MWRYLEATAFTIHHIRLNIFQIKLQLVNCFLSVRLNPLNKVLCVIIEIKCCFWLSSFFCHYHWLQGVRLQIFFLKTILLLVYQWYITYINKFQRCIYYLRSNGKYLNWKNRIDLNAVKIGTNLISLISWKGKIHTIRKSNFFRTVDT